MNALVGGQVDYVDKAIGKMSDDDVWSSVEPH